MKLKPGLKARKWTRPFLQFPGPASSNTSSKMVIAAIERESTDPVSDTTRKYGFHDDTGTLATNDAKAQTSPIIDECDHFHLGPVGV